MSFFPIWTSKFRYTSLTINVPYQSRRYNRRVQIFTIYNNWVTEFLKMTWLFLLGTLFLIRTVSEKMFLDWLVRHKLPAVQGKWNFVFFIVLLSSIPFSNNFFIYSSLENSHYSHHVYRCQIRLIHLGITFFFLLYGSVLIHQYPLLYISIFKLVRKVKYKLVKSFWSFIE